MAIILDAADATTAARTGARALACQALRPSAVTSQRRFPAKVSTTDQYPEVL